MKKKWGKPPSKKELREKTFTELFAGMFKDKNTSAMKELIKAGLRRPDAI